MGNASSSQFIIDLDTLDAEIQSTKTEFVQNLLNFLRGAEYHNVDADEQSCYISTFQRKCCKILMNLITTETDKSYREEIIRLDGISVICNLINHLSDCENCNNPNCNVIIKFDIVKYCIRSLIGVINKNDTIKYQIIVQCFPSIIALSKQIELDCNFNESEFCELESNQLKSDYFNIHNLFMQCILYGLQWPLLLQLNTNLNINITKNNINSTQTRQRQEQMDVTSPTMTTNNDGRDIDYKTDSDSDQESQDTEDTMGCGGDGFDEAAIFWQCKQEAIEWVCIVLFKLLARWKQCCANECQDSDDIIINMLCDDKCQSDMNDIFLNGLRTIKYISRDWTMLEKNYGNMMGNIYQILKSNIIHLLVGIIKFFGENNLNVNHNNNNNNNNNNNITRDTKKQQQEDKQKGKKKTEEIKEIKETLEKTKQQMPKIRNQAQIVEIVLEIILNMVRNASINEEEDDDNDDDKNSDDIVIQLLFDAGYVSAVSSLITNRKFSQKKTIKNLVIFTFATIITGATREQITDIFEHEQQGKNMIDLFTQQTHGLTCVINVNPNDNGIINSNRRRYNYKNKYNCNNNNTYNKNSKHNQVVKFNQLEKAKRLKNRNMHDIRLGIISVTTLCQTVITLKKHGSKYLGKFLQQQVPATPMAKCTDIGVIDCIFEIYSNCNGINSINTAAIDDTTEFILMVLKAVDVAVKYPLNRHFFVLLDGVDKLKQLLECDEQQRPYVNHKIKFEVQEILSKYWSYNIYRLIGWDFNICTFYCNVSQSSYIDTLIKLFYCEQTLSLYKPGKINCDDDNSDSDEVDEKQKSVSKSMCCTLKEQDEKQSFEQIFLFILHFVEMLIKVYINKMNCNDYINNNQNRNYNDNQSRHVSPRRAEVNKVKKFKWNSNDHDGVSSVDDNDDESGRILKSLIDKAMFTLYNGICKEFISFKNTTICYIWNIIGKYYLYCQYNLSLSQIYLHKAKRFDAKWRNGSKADSFCSTILCTREIELYKDLFWLNVILGNKYECEKYSQLIDYSLDYNNCKVNGIRKSNCFIDNNELHSIYTSQAKLNRYLNLKKQARRKLACSHMSRNNNSGINNSNKRKDDSNKCDWKLFENQFLCKKKNIAILKNITMLKQCNWEHCRKKSVKLKRCKKCRSVFYCSKLCQKKDWNLFAGNKPPHRFSCCTLRERDYSITMKHI